MTWTFHVVVTEQRRLLARVLQILDTQMVEIHSFSAGIERGNARIQFMVSSELDKAYRIEALLHRLEGVESVSVAVLTDS